MPLARILAVDLVRLDDEPGGIDQGSILGWPIVAPEHLGPMEVWFRPLPIAPAHRDEHHASWAQARGERPQQAAMFLAWRVKDRVEGHDSVHSELAGSKRRHVANLVVALGDRPSGKFDLLRRDVDADDVEALVDEVPIDRHYRTASDVQNQTSGAQEVRKPLDVSLLLV
jgi:hypothetical protein